MGHEWMLLPAFTYYFVETLIQHPDWSFEEIATEVDALFATFDTGQDPVVYDGIDGGYYF